MKLLIQKLVALFFVTMMLAACGNKEEAMSTEGAPAEDAASAPAEAAAEPAQEEPGGWVPPAE